MDNSEKIIFTNSFGTVSDKRIIVNYKNGSKDFPLKQISSVSFERKKNIPFAIFYFVVSIAILVVILNLLPVSAAVMGGASVLIVFCVLVGIAYCIGNYQIKLCAAGQNRNPIRVEMAKTKQGRDFFEAIRKQIVFNK